MVFLSKTNGLSFCSFARAAAWDALFVPNGEARLDQSVRASLE